MSSSAGKNDPLDIVRMFARQLNTFSVIARDRFHSWKDHPEYEEALFQSLERTRQFAETFPAEVGERLLEVILETRLLFVGLQKSYKRGEFQGALLLGLGQEAIGAGLGVAMRADDVLARDHRSVSAAIARGTPVEDFWKNHFLRVSGPTGGYDPNVHFSDLKRLDFGFMASDMAMSAVLVNGGTWYQNAKKQHEKGAPLDATDRSCGVAIFGDGAASNGIAHAGMNFAKANALPILFTILNNRIALRTPAAEEHGDIDLANRGFAYEMPMLTVDGDNIFEVYLAARWLLDFTRTASHPALLHTITLRRSGHNETENAAYVRKIWDDELLEQLPLTSKFDPLDRARSMCETLGFVSADRFATLRNTVSVRVEEGHKAALADAEPSVDSFREALMDPKCETVAALAAQHPTSDSHRTITMREAIQEGLREALERDPLLSILGEDIGYPGGGVFEVTAPLLDDFRDRIRNATLDEMAIGGFVVGACLLGGRVIAEYQFWNFFLSGPAPILTLAATRPFMQKIGVSAVLRGPTGYAPQSNHYHESWPETYLLKSLGVKVVVPATPEDAKGLLLSAVEDPDLVAILEEMSFYGLRGEVPEGLYYTPFTPITRREGSDVTLITWGPKMLQLALEAAETLAKEGIDLEVIDLRVLNPLDKDFLFASIRKTGRVIVLHEDSSFMGFGAEIAATIAEDPIFYELRARIQRLAARNTPIPGHLALENARLPQHDDIVQSARALMRES